MLWYKLCDIDGCSSTKAFIFPAGSTILAGEYKVMCSLGAGSPPVAPPYIPGLHTSALPKDRITQPKVPQHSTPQHSTQGSSTLNPRFPNMRPWFKNVSAYSTSTCPSHSKMPKWPVRAENSVPEAQTLCVERFLRDLFNAPCHGSVCGGGRHQNRVPVLF